MTEIQVVGIDKVYVNLIQKPAQDPIDLMFSMAKKSVKIDEPTFTEAYLSKFSREEKIKFLKKVIFEFGHKGLLEHPFYSFEIWGVSRSMTHQAVRNRIASFLEGSLRYVNPIKTGIFKYIVPMALRGDDPVKAALREEYQKDMERAAELYSKWYLVGEKLGLEEGRCKELGRTTLPHSSCTTYSFTMNLASLVMLANKRACVRAEEEFRTVVDPIIAIIKEELPGFLDDLGPYCEMYGYCPEGSLSCGQAPTLKQLKDCYNSPAY